MLLSYAGHSPLMSGRPSSPLNPYPQPYVNGHGVGSSSPLTSPSPSSSTSAAAYFPYPAFPSPVFRPNAMHSKSAPGPSNRQTGPPIGANGTNTRYARPRASKRPSLSHPPSSPDLFSEGTTPMEGAMWRERYSRRMVERERRKKVREQDLDRRRGVGPSSEPASGFDEDESDAERRAQEDDEEIFRRLMVLQRQRARHAALVAHEAETGGLEPDLLEGWEDDQDSLAWEGQDPPRRFGGDVQMPSSPIVHRQAEPLRGDESDEEREAALAEEAERQFEEAYGIAAVTPFCPARSLDLNMDMDMDVGMDMDWETFGTAIDIE